MNTQNLNISTLVGLPFAVAASAILPVLLYTLYWKGFTTRGATWGIFGGLLSAMLLVLFSPAVSGNPTALPPDSDFAIFPLRNPGLVSIPIGFLLGWLGSVLDPHGPGDAKFTEVDRRIAAGTRTG
ncbi:sodium:solute symporter family transporter [Streptomyces sp. 7N604]|uniref:sodium:solute symporter family transporter n=1 Tax=Streptomyces sp. 7N604 TaxID=3457415 RepID=UPI003FD2F92C